MQKKNRRSLSVELTIAILVALAIVVCRIVIATPNFQPVMALALFGGFFFDRKWLAGVAPLVGVTVSDLFFLGSYQLPVMMAVYGATILPLAMGCWIRQRERSDLGFLVSAGASAIGSAFLFFAITNVAVWMFLGVYRLDSAGFVSCMIAALPFFKWTLASNLIFSGALFSGYWVFDRCFCCKTAAERRAALRTFSS